MADDRKWMAQGLCRGVDPDLFHPTRGEDSLAAKAVCAECPVRDQCLDYALANKEALGVWGGTSARERALMKVPRRKVPAEHGSLTMYRSGCRCKTCSARQRRRAQEYKARKRTA